MMHFRALPRLRIFGEVKASRNLSAIGQRTNETHQTGRTANGQTISANTNKMNTQTTVTKKQAKINERNEQIEKLRSWFPKGSTVYCTVKSVSRSGMSRVISIQGYGRDENGKVVLDDKTGEPWQVFPNYAASLALDWPLVKGSRDGVKVGGCGMDMCFHLVYTLSSILYGEGYALNHR